MPMPALPMNHQVDIHSALPAFVNHLYPTFVFFSMQNAVEPMQVDVSEENENAEEEPYIVENPTLVVYFTSFFFMLF